MDGEPWVFDLEGVGAGAGAGVTEDLGPEGGCCVGTGPGIGVVCFGGFCDFPVALVLGG